MRYIALESHPNDSRAKIKDDGICQTLSSRMGTGGGNVPLVLEILDEDIDHPERSGGAVMHWNYNEIAGTLRALMSSSHPPLVVLEDEEKDTDRRTHINN